jgi:MYXO-CTERM domain-containing protein
MRQHSATTLALVTFLALATPLAQADIIPDGNHGVSHDFVIEGIDQFPGLAFFAYPLWMGGGVEPLDEGEAFSFYKFASPHLIAMPVSASVQATDIETLLEDPALPRTERPFSCISTAPDNDPTRRIVSTFRVTGIEGQVILIEQVSQVRLNSSGLPVNTQAGTLSAFMTHGAVPAILPALALLGLVAVRRRRES